MNPYTLERCHSLLLLVQQESRSCPFFIFQIKYKEGGKKDISASLYSQLPETMETQFAKEISDIQSEVNLGEATMFDALDGCRKWCQERCLKISVTKRIPKITILSLAQVQRRIKRDFHQPVLPASRDARDSVFQTALRTAEWGINPSVKKSINQSPNMYGVRFATPMFTILCHQVNQIDWKCWENFLFIFVY